MAKRRLPTFLTRPERDRLLGIQMSNRDLAIVLTFLKAGLRSNELRMLDLDDLDFDEMTLMVRYGKRDKQRLIPLHTDAAFALEVHLNSHELARLRAEAAPDDQQAVFLSERKRRLSNRRLRTLIKGLGQRARLKKSLHPHSLRHTFAVSLREAGEELDVVKDLLGHASIKTTEIYTHCSVDQLRAAVDRI